MQINLELRQNMPIQEVRRWLESPPQKSWLCSDQCCGKRDLDFWVAREETLRRQILQEQEEVLRSKTKNSDFTFTSD